MEIYSLDRMEQVAGVLSNEGETAVLTSAILKEPLNKMHTLDLEVNSLAVDVQHIKEENYLLLKDLSDNWKCFIVREITEKHSTEEIKEVYAEDSSQELIDYIVRREFKDQSITLQSLLNVILLGSRWQVGAVDTTPAIKFPVETKNKTALEVLYDAVEAFNMEVNFRIEVTGNKITGRFVDIKKHIGANYGKRFEYTKDIVSIERKVDSSKIKTACIPEGAVPQETEEERKENKETTEEVKKPPIDITSIEWKRPANPIDKPKGQDFIEIPEATAQWGYLKADGSKTARVMYYNNTECLTPEDLINKAYAVLKEASKPVVNYKLDVVDLFALTGDEELSFEYVNTGDIVTVIDEVFNPPIELRTEIINKETNLLRPEESKVELGSFIRNLVDSKATASLTEQINSTVSTVTNGLDYIESKVVNVSNDFKKFENNFNSIELAQNWVKNSDFTNDIKGWNCTGTLTDIADIPYFTKGVLLQAGQYVKQDITGAVQLINTNITLSAFIKGSGYLEIAVTYKDKKSNLQTEIYKSNLINSTSWERFSYTSSIAIKDYMAQITGISIMFTATATTAITGLQLNLGLMASKYIKNSSDKFGTGVYEQVKAVTNTAFKQGTGYVYIDEDDGIWVYDKPVNGRPTRATVLKGGMFGIGNWNNQTQSWDIRTFIDGNLVNASCINTGSLSANLLKAGAIQSLDGSVYLNLENGSFTFGGKNGRALEITENEVRIIHKDGSVTVLDSEDATRNFGNGTCKSYHCLANVIGFTASGNPDSDITVQLPDEYKGKDFTAQAVLSDTFTDSWNMTESWVLQRMVVYVSGQNKEAGTVTIKGYRTDKNYNTGAYRRCPVAGMLIVLA
ncbi:phage tail protein (plasmid) [Clostridium perfringens]|uniref:phage tail spike protein n=1 Tax=Clostridium perfringens TaxID=1502 RepID=UPI001CC94422|nr:phage tail spike protein [Clostridium perfringens]UBK83427.1 phage tail protein [Clostridium perfringens]